jgi:hypothetical protein
VVQPVGGLDGLRGARTPGKTTSSASRSWAAASALSSSAGAGRWPPNRALMRARVRRVEQVQAERLDLGQHAIQGRGVQQAGQHGVRAVLPRRQRRERRQHGGAEVPVDPDQVRGGCRVHDAMITGGRVTPDHRDRVAPFRQHIVGNRSSRQVRSQITVSDLRWSALTAQVSADLRVLLGRPA